MTQHVDTPAAVGLQRDLTAADAMTSPVVTVPETATLFDAWTVMVSFHVRHVVVVRDDHCLGVLDDRDLVSAWNSGPSALQATPVRRLLRDRTSCVLTDALLSQVADLMNTSRVDAVPVVEANGKLTGLITAGDIVHSVSRHGLHEPVGEDFADAN
jgi:CBS domain-containing protein